MMPRSRDSRVGRRSLLRVDRSPGTPIIRSGPKDAHAYGGPSCARAASSASPRLALLPSPRPLRPARLLFKENARSRAIGLPGARLIRSLTFNYRSIGGGNRASLTLYGR